MRRRIISAAAAVLLGLAGVFVAAAPAAAIPPACNISIVPWIFATDGSPANWGKVKYCISQDGTGTYPLFQVQDVLTDGYQVHLEFHDNFSGVYHATGNGTACENVQSAGAVVTSCWSSSTWSYYGGNDLWMRLVKGRACCPHQDAGHWEYASDWWQVIST